MTTVSNTSKALLITVATLAGAAGIYPFAFLLIAEQRFTAGVVLVVIAGAIPGALTALAKPWEWDAKAAVDAGAGNNATDIPK